MAKIHMKSNDSDKGLMTLPFCGDLKGMSITVSSTFFKEQYLLNPKDCCKNCAKKLGVAK